MVTHQNHTGRRLHKQTPAINAMAQSAIGGIATTGWQEAVGGEEASMSLAIPGALSQWDISRTPNGRPLASANSYFLQSAEFDRANDCKPVQLPDSDRRLFLRRGIRIGWAMLAVATLRDGTWTNHVPQWPLAWL